MSDSHQDTPFIAPDAAELNELFPGYEIEGLIATGGMGAVYCALQKSLDRRVALKILPKELSKDAAFCEGFQSEAKAMARLNHPNLIGVYDFGEVDDMLFIIMEFVPGQSIYHSAHGQAIDPAEVVRLVSSVCSGLAHAHENGIIHRDIKPSNILLDLGAQPKIGDFGLARPIERKIREGEEIFGTPHYTAPEVVNAPHTVDYRADIFSVGVLLHELLTGKLPADDPRPPSVISRCDPRFDAIVKKATSPYPATRYASAAEMAKDLLAITASRPRHAPLPTHGAPGQGIPKVAAPLKPKRLVHAKSSSGPSFTFLLILAAIAGGLYYYHKNYGLSFLIPSKPVDPIVVNPKPAPAPAPIPEAAPDLTPTPSLDDLAAANTPEPAEPDDIAPVGDELPPPKMDIEAFYQKARKIMQDRAKSQINQYQTALTNNLGGFESDMRRSVRKLGAGSSDRKKELEDSLLELKESGNRLPADLAETFGEFPDIEELAPSYLGKQATLDATFRRTMATHAATYIVGMQKQIERSQAENDAAAIKIIEGEINLTREDTEYFPNLMLGIKPQPPSDSPSDEADSGGGFITPPDSDTGGFVLPPEE